MHPAHPADLASHTVSRISGAPQVSKPNADSIFSVDDPYITSISGPNISCNGSWNCHISPTDLIAASLYVSRAASRGSALCNCSRVSCEMSVNSLSTVIAVVIVLRRSSPLPFVKLVSSLETDPMAVIVSNASNIDEAINGSKHLPLPPLAFHRLRLWSSSDAWF